MRIDAAVVCEQLDADRDAPEDGGFAADLARHLAICPLCQAAELPVEALLARFRALPAPPLAPSIAQRLSELCRRWQDDHA